MDEQSPHSDQSCHLSLDEVARRAGVASEQVRDWRAAGLLGEPDRARFSLRDVERARLIQLFVRRGVDQSAIAAWIRSGEMDRHVELLLPQSGATYRLAEACATLGLDADMVRRVWESAGGNIDVLDEEDMEALRALKPAIDAGFPEAAIAQLVRVFADAMQRVAETEARLFHFYVRNALAAQGLSDTELARAVWQAGEQVSVLDQPTLMYFHRRALRHAIADTAVLELAQQAGLIRRSATAGEVDLSLAFVDLAGFTPLTETKGDLEAAQVLERFSILVRQTVAALDGHVVKQIGDAFMLVFPDARSAVIAALSIAQRARGEAQFPAVRGAVHRGQALYREGDYVGTTVNIAARLVGTAEPHQVVVSAVARQAAAQLADTEFVPLPKQRLKGISDDVEVFEARPAAAPPQARLRDPACGLELSPAEVAARLTLGGTDYAFCSEACVHQFVAQRDARRA
jgi:adenylate cyclase